MISKVPKRISLVVNKAQDLRIISNKAKKRSNKWRVFFLGVLEKLATAKIESAQGSPEWLCEITLTAKNPRDPICLVVSDSKGNHAGQVVINMEQVPCRPPDCSPGERPPLLAKNLIRAELEPTKKTSHPNGILYYWIWVEEYWTQEEIDKFATKKSLSKSLQNLSSSALNVFRRKTSSTKRGDLGSTSTLQLPQMNGDHHNYNHYNTPSNPFDGLQNGIGGDLNGAVNHNYSQQGSDASTSTCNSAFYNNNITSPQSIHHQYTQSCLTSPNSNSPALNNRNPFDELTTAVDISIDNQLNETLTNGRKFSAMASRPTNLSHQQSLNSRESPSNKKRYGLFNKFRAKKSKSSADLSSLVSRHELEAATATVNVPQSVGKQHGQRLFEKRGTLEGKDNLFLNGDTSTLRGDPFQDNSKDIQNGDNAQLYRRYSTSSQFIIGGDPIETNHEDIPKKDLIGLIDNLKSQLKDLQEKCRSLESENSRLKNENQRNESELKVVKDDLANLRVRLLEAGHTKYLEK